jgi:hypothetical protein
MANELNEAAPKIVTRNQEFHGTLADIKATPKSDSSKPDSRLESLNRKTFF